MTKDSLKNCVVSISDVFGSGACRCENLFAFLSERELFILLEVLKRWNIEGIDDTKDCFRIVVESSVTAFLKVHKLSQEVEEDCMVLTRIAAFMCSLSIFAVSRVWF